MIVSLTNKLAFTRAALSCDSFLLNPVILAYVFKAVKDTGFIFDIGVP